MASNGLTGAIYAGGQKVDYVAFAVAELAPLILAFGRGCENGSSYRSISPTRRPLRLAMLCNRWPATTLSLICTHRRANGYRITRYGEVYRNRASRRSEYV